VHCYPFIEAEKAQRRNVKRACELLKVSRAAFYAARDGGSSDLEREDAALAAEVKTVHDDSKGRHGAPRVHAQLPGGSFIAQRRTEAKTRAALSDSSHFQGTPLAIKAWRRCRVRLDGDRRLQDV
jgi:hypothetical protein